MGRFSKILLLGVVFALAFVVAQPATAQISTGSISGTVVDQTGASVPGASVTLTSRNTGEKTTATTGDTGSFRFSLLPVGVYDLEITKQGFKKLKLTSVAVNANVEHGISSVTLELGASSTTVEVSAAPPVVETAQAQVTDTITSIALQEAPSVQALEGLDFLALQLPGVTRARDNAFSNSNGIDFNVNGIRSRNNDQQIDGQNNNDNSVAGPAVFLGNTDFVQEYQVTTNNFGPEYGRNAGSVVNIVTKNGTNNWHGTISGQENNSVLSTRSNTQIFFEGLKKIPRYNLEYTSATIGGPLWKDHVFVFGGFDDAILSAKANLSTGLFTPTPAGVGIMSSCFPGSPSVQALSVFGPYGVGGGNPTPLGAPITQSLSGGTFPGFTPNNTTTGKCDVPFAGVSRLLGQSAHEYDWVYRTDVVINNSDRFSGRYLYQKLVFFNTDAFGTGASGYPANVPSLGQNILLDWTHTFTSAMVNEFRAGFGRANVEFGGNTIGNTIPNQGKIGSAPAQVTLSDATALGFGPASNAPQGRIVNTYQLQDNWSYVRGRHQWSAGVNFTYQRTPNIFLPDLNGAYNFTSWSRFAQDVPSSITIAEGSPSLDFREYDTFLYAGDNWKIKDNLTLNLGLTWSYFGQPANLFHSITTKQQTSSKPFWLPSLPLSATTNPAVPSVKNAFGPSVGFAYSPKWGGFLTGNGKTVFRGGYRLAYDPAFYNIYINVSTSAPEVFLQTLTGSAAANPAIKLPANMIGPTIRAQLESAGVIQFGTKDPRNFSRTTDDPHLGPDRAHEWSFGVQRELSSHAALEVRYVGNHGFNLYQSINQNPFIAGLSNGFPTLYAKEVAHLNPAFAVPNGTQPCTTPVATVPNAIGRLNCNFGRTTQRGNYAYSDYNGLQVQLRANNLFRQLTMNTSYTFSKTTDNTTEIFSTFGGGNTRTGSQDPLNFLGFEHGLSGLDYPHNLTISFVEQIPAYRGQHGVIGHILGGWSVAGTYYIESGQPYTATQTIYNCISNFSSCPAFVGLAGAASGTYPFDSTFGEAARPFIGSESAPQTAVGIFAGDACTIYSFTGLEPVCALAPTTLISLNGINLNSGDPATLQAYNPATVSKKQVRLITNTLIADAVFGTPFGNAARNNYRDAFTNYGDFSLYKDIKFGERATLRWSMAMLNVFNHPNFSSVDPNLQDAGFTGESFGFAQPSNFTGSTITSNLLGSANGQRTIIFGLKVIF